MRIPGVEPDGDRGERIRAARLRRGLTQPDMARAVGVSVRTYWKWEKGGVLSHPNLRVLASELRTTPEHLLGIEERDARRDGPISPAVFSERLDAIEEALRSLQEVVEGMALALSAATEGRESPPRRGRRRRSSGGSRAKGS